MFVCGMFLTRWNVCVAALFAIHIKSGVYGSHGTLLHHHPGTAPERRTAVRRSRYAPWERAPPARLQHGTARPAATH